jgi:hypothetical protein
VIGKAHGAISLPPTLRKVREGWGTHGDVVQAKSKACFACATTAGTMAYL